MMERKRLTEKELADLEKGDVVSIERLEEATDQKFGSSAYGLAILPIGQQIEEYFAEHKGLTVTTHLDKGNLKICTDPEAVGRNWKRGKHHLKGLGRAVHRMNGVDVHNLTATELRSHESKQRALSCIWQVAEKEAIVQAALPPHIRKVPGLMEADTR
jgi:hypothetical protein